MALDTVGLMDALGLRRAHLVGASLGGQIAQIIATEFPMRAASLVSMMSTAGKVEMPDPAAMRIFALPQATTREQAMDNAVQTFRIIGSPEYPVADEAIRERAGRVWDRGHDMTGIIRQSMAAIVTGDRAARLASVTTPTLVIHGSVDLMCRVDAGRATAEAIPGARLEIITGMGHNLPPGLWPRLSDLIAEHVWRVEKASH
jgi:pimeloyl-ACP methyl ester carboxylesterase